MTILHSDLFPLGYPLIARYVYTTPGGITVPVPLGSTWLRAGAGGAGGFQDSANGWGGGAAYAFAGEACAYGSTYTGQVGDSQFSRPAANTNLGDSWVRRPDASILTYADRGRPDGTPGATANCTGSTKRAGSAPTASQGGASAGDDADPFPLGFGGRGASDTVAAWYGGGGGYSSSGAYYFPQFPAGDGRLVLEFYRYNPGYE